MTESTNTLEAAGIPAGATPIGTIYGTGGMDDGPMFCWFGCHPDGRSDPALIKADADFYWGETKI